MNADDVKRLGDMLGSTELGERTEQVIKLQAELSSLRPLAAAADAWFESIVMTTTPEEAELALALRSYQAFMATGFKPSGSDA